MKRILLFEMINCKKIDLNTILAGADDTANMVSYSDQLIREVSDQFVISDFKEMLSKMDPHIYSYLDGEKCEVSFSLQKENPSYIKINLDRNNPVIGYLIRLINQRGSSHFWCESLEKWLVPKAKIREFVQLREQIKQSYLIKNDQVEEIFMKLKKFDDSIFLLYLYLNHINMPVLPEMAQLSKQSQVRYLTGSLKIETVIKEDQFQSYRQYIIQNLTNIESQNLTLLACCLLEECQRNLSVMHQDEQLFKQYQAYADQISKQFKITAHSLIENIIKIYLLFKEQEDTTLFITNCEAASFLNPEKKKRLQTYLETVNEKQNTSDSITDAVIIMREKGNENERTLKRIRFETGSLKVDGGQDNLDLKELIKLLEQYQIRVHIRKDTSFMEGGTFSC